MRLWLPAGILLAWLGMALALAGSPASVNSSRSGSDRPISAEVGYAWRFSGSLYLGMVDVVLPGNVFAKDEHHLVVRAEEEQPQVVVLVQAPIVDDQVAVETLLVRGGRRRCR